MTSDHLNTAEVEDGLTKSTAQAAEGLLETAAGWLDQITADPAAVLVVGVAPTATIGNRPDGGDRRAAPRPNADQERCWRWCGSAETERDALKRAPQVPVAMSALPVGDRLRPTQARR